MIEIGSANFLINVPSLPKEEFERYSTSLFDDWERSVEQNLILPDYSISLEIEEGSIKGGGKIAVALGALYLGIGNYGDFISGLSTIRDQVSYVTNTLFASATAPFDCRRENAKLRRSGGTLSRLHSLFDKVQRGILTADQATREASILLGADLEEAPDFLSELRRQFEQVPRYPEQLSFVDEEWSECEEHVAADTERAPRKSRPKPPLIPIPQHYRIEIWRESKKDKKHVKLTRLR
jgi:hypothetical protein